MGGEGYMWNNLTLPALLAPLCNPVQVVPSIQSVSAALSSLQGCTNCQSLLPGHQSSTSICLSFSLVIFPHQLCCTFIISFPPKANPFLFISGYFSDELPISLNQFYILTNSFLYLPPAHLSFTFSSHPNLLLPLRMLHFSHHPCFNITFVCDCLWPHSPFSFPSNLPFLNLHTISNHLSALFIFWGWEEGYFHKNCELFNLCSTYIQQWGIVLILVTAMVLILKGR